MDFNLDDARRRNNGTTPPPLDLSSSLRPKPRTTEPTFSSCTEEPQVVCIRAILDNGEETQLKLGDLSDKSNPVVRALRSQLSVVQLRPTARFWTFNGANERKWFADKQIVKMANDYGFDVAAPAEAAEALNMAADLFVVDAKGNIIVDDNKRPIRANRAEKAAYREKAASRQTT